MPIDWPSLTVWCSMQEAVPPLLRVEKMAVWLAEASTVSRQPHWMILLISESRKSRPLCEGIQCKVKLVFEWRRLVGVCETFTVSEVCSFVIYWLVLIGLKNGWHSCLTLSSRNSLNISNQVEMAPHKPSTCFMFSSISLYKHPPPHPVPVTLYWMLRHWSHI